MEEKAGSKFVENVKEVLLTLVSMRSQLAEAAKSTSSAAAAVMLEEEEVDWGDDDDIDIEAASQALSAGDAQAMEMMELLLDEQRRLAKQVQDLAKRGVDPEVKEEGQEELVERVWAALQSADAEAAERLMRQLPPSAVGQMKDVNGVTPLHIAARERWIGLTAWLLEVSPAMASATTLSRQPPRWTPIMSLANQPKARDAAVADREAEVVRMLLEQMPLAAINIQSGTGATVTHLAVPKGNHSLAVAVLWAVYEKGGWPAVKEHLDLANSMGKSALDVAWRSSSSFARVLQDEWWAVSYTPAPASDERQYASRWRRR